MSDHHDGAPGAEPEGAIEEVDGELVVLGAPTPTRAQAAGAVVVKQAAAVAATTFAAGVVTVAAVRATRAHRARRRHRAQPVLATRSFLVDVHLLGTRR